MDRLFEGSFKIAKVMKKRMATLEEMAMQYAMVAHPQYESGKFGGDWAEAKQNRIRHEMFVQLGAFNSQEAIKKAQKTLKIINFH